MFVLHVGIKMKNGQAAAAEQVFNGPFRAAIYVGDMYLVLNATDPIRTLTRHFDNLIRAADVNAHETAAFARGLADRLSESRD